MVELDDGPLDARALRRAWGILRIGLDVLVAALIALVLWRADGAAELILGVVFTVAYYAGSIWGLRAEAGAIGGAQSGRARRGMLVWLVVIICVWTVLLTLSPEAAYLAFPLFFVAMHAGRGLTGVALVAVLTAIAVLALGLRSGLTVGGVVGPILGGATAVAVGWGFAVLQRESAARARLIGELIAAREDHARMSRRAGELAERARIAGDIHDTVAQGLASVGLLLHAAETDIGAGRTFSALEHIGLARATAADNLAETRRIIAELQPAPLAGADLPVAVARLCAQTPGVDCSCHVDGDVRPVPDAVAARLVRVIQTALGNVVAHAAATRCTVTLTYQDDAVSADIVDDGRGFNPDAPVADGSFGLAGATERLAAIGGTLTVESAPGEGCGVNVRVPIPMAGAAAAGEAAP